METLKELLEKTPDFKYVLGTMPAELGQYLDAVLYEKRGQFLEKGYVQTGDDEYLEAELYFAGLAYEFKSAAYWPETWSPHSFKPGTEMRNYEKAGALYLAEMERLQRRLVKILEKMRNLKEQENGEDSQT